MIKKIAHLSDIHIRKALDRHTEYREVFNKLYNSLKKESPDRIVVVGDIYDNFIDLEGEALILVAEFLTNLSNISKTIITRGNHDIMKKNKYRIDTIETVMTLIENSGCTYYNKSGFYNDDNIVWCVWDHVDQINPWSKEIKKEKNRTYIDLYHNPVNGSKLFNGVIINGKYPNITDFKGDYSFFGDIHLRQFFKNKTKAYCSSLIQQNFGESIENHGYLLWDIYNKSVKEIDIENEYKFLNIEIDHKINYDNIDLKIDINKNKKIKTKIKWKDYNTNINIDNEIKIKNIIKEKIGSEYISIESIPIYVDINESKMLTETIDITDNSVQQSIFIEYLKNNKISNDDIDQLILIDNVINKRLNYIESKNIIWSIDKIWFNNFKSYGDNNVIDWKDKNGIIQIHGINQQGKSTIIDVISYILYGTTLSTTKREKNGDNRFINLNRDKDYCDGGIVLNINNENFVIYRKTIRKKKRNGNISSCSSILEYYKGEIITEENKLVGERRNDTQKLIKDVIGDFNDFIRLSLTTSDNINDMLSMDRSVFIDNIIKDAGYEIFDKKLNEFKEYKKSLNLEKIVLDIDNTELEINNINNNIKTNKEIVKNIKSQIIEYENTVKEYQNNKENLLRGLKTIDETIINLDIKTLKSVLYKKELLLNIHNNEINKLKNRINDININKNIILDLKINQEKYNDLNNTKSELSEKINNINNTISRLNNTKSDIKKEIENKYKEIQNDFNNIKNEYINKVKIINNDIKNIKINGTNIKNNINELKKSVEETGTCPTCLRPLENINKDHINNNILKMNDKIKILMNEGKLKLKEIKELNIKITNIEKLDIYENESYIEYVKLKNKEMESNDKKIKTLLSSLDIFNNKFKSIKDDIDDIVLQINKSNTEIEKFNNKKQLESKLKDIILSDKEILIDIEKIKDKIKIYLKNEKIIKSNIEINLKISNISEDIDTIISEIKNLNNKKDNIVKMLTIKENSKNKLLEKIQKFKNQEKIEFIHSIYLKSMHRDGLPTYLLKKSIHIINNELNLLLSNLDFNLIFDDNLILKMKSKLNDVTYNAIEGSGMERTFNSCVLKMALRKINNISKPDFILFDEIMNKMVDKSIETFIDLLYELKNYINKIIIIEHIHQMNYDYLITVTKNEQGISSFEFF
jgi:DNA repair exonuclease SbcCD ATPase subunit